MKKITLFLVLFITVFQNTHAQIDQASLLISEKQKENFKTSTQGVVATDDGGYYVLRAKYTGFILIFIPIGGEVKLFLDYYGFDLKLKKTIPLENVARPAYGTAEENFEFFAQDTEKNLFVHFSTIEEPYTTLYRSKLNKGNASFGPKEKVFSIKNLEDGDDRKGSFSLLHSPNGQKHAIISMMDLNKEKEQTHLYVHSLDQDLNSTGSQEEIVSFSKKFFAPSFGKFATDNFIELNNITNLVLTNSGTFNTILKVKTDNRWFGRDDYDYHLLSLSDYSNQAQMQKLNLPEKFMLDISIKAKDDALYCSGFYSDRNAYDLDGIFIFEVDEETLNIKSQNVQDFTNQQREDFLVSSYGTKTRRDRKLKKKLKKDRKEVKIKKYDVLDYLPFDDGSNILIAEEQYTYSTSTYVANANGGGHYSTTTYYVYGDLVFLHFDEKGDINWIKNIHKSQKYGSPRQSVYHLKKENKVYLTYFEDKVLKLKSIDKKGRYGSKDLGIYSRKSELGKYTFRTSSAVRASENEVIGFAFRPRSLKMLKIKF
jgi:hypothetical protein